MNSFTKTLAVVLLLGSTTASAQSPDDGTEFLPHDRERGELSPGASAPTRDAMMASITQASPEQLQALLEYGERVECHACVPLLQANLLEAGDPDVRRISAWWLRRRLFGFEAIMRSMRITLESDADPVRRSRAAEAIGEFLDPNGLTVLRDAATTDDAAVVRQSAIRALGRLNHPGGITTVAAALGDDSVEVRRAAIEQVLRLNFFREHEALITALADEDDEVRMRAARLVGEMRVEGAVTALSMLLRGDTNRDVRQAAAWSLGMINGAEARGALREAADGEEDSLVRDAIDIALRMRR